MFPETKSRETSGLSGKQNYLFSSGPYIKCIIFNSPYPMITVCVLSRVTLVITITAGVIQAKRLYFTKAFLLSS